MKHVFAVVLVTAFTAACGSSSPTGPSEMSPASMAGTWAGSSSDSSNSMGAGSMMGQAGLGAMTWQLTQSGSTVTGSMSFSDMQGGSPGSFVGTMSGEDMTLTMNLPSGSMMSSGCSARATGTAHVTGTTMTGNYTGSNSCTGGFTNGQMSMTRR